MYSKSLKFINFILIHIGITYLGGHVNKYYNAKYYWQAFCFTAFGAILIPQAAYTITHAKDIVVLAECILVNVTFLLAFIKLACHVTNRREIKKIIDKLIFDVFEHNIPLILYIRDFGAAGKRLKELEMLLKESYQKLMNIIMYCLIMYGGAAYFTVLMQAVRPIILNFIHPEPDYREFPYKMMFPWNQTSTPIYQLTFVLHVCFGVACVAAYVGLDCLFALILGHLIRQLRLVGFITSHLDELVAEVREKHSAEWERDSTTLLAYCARHIARIKWYCERMNIIFKPILVAQAVCSSGVICLCMLMIAKSEEETIINSQNLMYITFEVTTMVQIGGHCVIGQLLKNMSEKLPEKVIGSWWEHSRRHQSCVKILHLTVQRPITMHIWGTIELSYATFGAIIKTAVSYFTLLLTITEN